MVGGMRPLFLMATKHSSSLRCQAEIAMAVGVQTRIAATAFGIARTTLMIWMKPWRAKSQKKAVKAWRQAHPEAVSRHNKNYVNKYPEKTKENNRRSYSAHYANNPEYYAEKTATRRRNTWKIPLTLSERRQIQKMLRDARRLSIETGIPHEVDHIWPISRGGWHHPANMRIISKRENRAKHNRLPTLEEVLRYTKVEEIP